MQQQKIRLQLSLRLNYYRIPVLMQLDEELQLQRRSFTRVLRSDRDVYEARTEAAESIADRR